MPTHIDLTPSWRGVLQLLLAAWRDGSAKGQRMAEEELIRMAQLADNYVREHEDLKYSVNARRIQNALDYIETYSSELDRLEIPPNGDDWNEMTSGIRRVLVDGFVPPVDLKLTGR